MQGKKKKKYLNKKEKRKKEKRKKERKTLRLSGKDIKGEWQSVQKEHNQDTSVQTYEVL